MRSRRTKSLTQAISMIYDATLPEIGLETFLARLSDEVGAKSGVIVAADQCGDLQSITWSGIEATIRLPF